MARRHRVADRIVQVFLWAAVLALAAGASARAAEYHEYRDDFSAGLAGWVAGPSWRLVARRAAAEHESGAAYRADTGGDSLAWRSGWRLGASWAVSARLTIAGLHGDGGATGSGGLALSASAAAPAPRLLATVERHSSGLSLLTVDYLDGDWHRLLSSGWLPGGDTSYRIGLSREAGDDFLHISVAGDRGLAYRADTPPVPLAVLDALVCPGLRANRAVVDFTRVSLATPSPAPAYYRTIARAAVHDLLRHFWTGSPANGHILATWNGYHSANLPDKRGVLWERGMLLMVLDDLYRATSDQTLRRALRDRIAADWKHTTAAYTAAELGAAGPPLSPASDDCGWNALAYLAVYDATGAPSALRAARGMVASAFARWSDDKLGGGLWYSDKRKVKSLYQVGLALAALRIYEITGDRAYLARARASYKWMEAHLLRPDGLYWCDYSPTGPVGADRPDDLHQAGSVVFLAGCMGMGVLQARLFRLTGDNRYRRQALRTAAAIRAHLTDGRGVLLDDRDAWTNGTFATAWARDVLSLRGIGEADRDLLRGTARAICVRARTAAGYYGGCWNGPADGPGSAWGVIGSRPEQIMTSASAVSVIVAAASPDH